MKKLLLLSVGLASIPLANAADEWKDSYLDVVSGHYSEIVPTSPIPFVAHENYSYAAYTILHYSRGDLVGMDGSDRDPSGGKFKYLFSPLCEITVASTEEKDGKLDAEHMDWGSRTLTRETHRFTILDSGRFGFDLTITRKRDGVEVAKGSVHCNTRSSSPRPITVREAQRTLGSWKWVRKD
ncbi:MAG: hypothetical protein JST04_06270 [Bdellovibrionales bacterium]|nr:hypothetical protein [Bdellovibrionales bacterium]